MSGNSTSTRQSAIHTVKSHVYFQQVLLSTVMLTPLVIALFIAVRNGLCPGGNLPRPTVARRGRHSPTSPPPGAPEASRGRPSAAAVAATAAARLEMASLVGPGDRIAERVLFGLAFVTRFFHLAEPAQIVCSGVDAFDCRGGGGSVG